MMLMIPHHKSQLSRHVSTEETFAAINLCFKLLLSYFSLLLKEADEKQVIMHC